MLWLRFAQVTGYSEFSMSYCYTHFEVFIYHSSPYWFALVPCLSTYWLQVVSASSSVFKVAFPICFHSGLIPYSCIQNTRRSNPCNNYLTTVTFDHTVYKSKQLFDTCFSGGAPRLWDSLPFSVEMLLWCVVFCLLPLWHCLSKAFFVSSSAQFLLSVDDAFMFTVLVAARWIPQT